MDNKALACLLLPLLLAGCGGGGGSDSAVASPDPGPNQAPVADAGSDQSLTTGATAQLSGAASHDPDGDALSYHWQLSQKPAGSTATLAGAGSVSASFVADLAGDYQLTLVVSDGQLDSSPDEVLVTASSPASGPVDLTNAILTSRDADCASYAGSYTAHVQDFHRSLDFTASLTISADADKCHFATNVIPNHDFDDGDRAFANNVSAQDDQYAVPRHPAFAASTTALTLETTNAMLLNGAVVDLLPAACWGVGDGKIGCNDDATPWRYDPDNPLADFGTDSHHAHAQPNGTYHYHGDPRALYGEAGDAPSPLIGFAADGFPVFGPYIEKNGQIVAVRSSYQLKAGTRPGGSEGPGGSYDGTYRDDYEYVAGAGDLDECNGMTVDGQYGYYISQGFPYVMNCFKGTPDSSFTKTGAALANRLHGHGLGYGQQHVAGLNDDDDH
ncbi:YHYH protein [Gallaecimonas kandeliae]|uniref:YHYH protein n=1 Tax=Gallaecimonas kandeliae TaxID=3029055 RepID=UPI00264978CA|nr:YHYH protein [Gallaecimonas kandeliae]WKE66205.1 YHYH protein [Gallaecimonas kandeliae]